MDFTKGGKAAIDRMVEAYGFKNRQSLCDHLGVSKSVLSNRYLRDAFPADFIVQCAIETGASLKWLATGEGDMFDNPKANFYTCPLFAIDQGELINVGTTEISNNSVPSHTALSKLVIADHTAYFITDTDRLLDSESYLIKLADEHMIRRMNRGSDDLVQLTNEKNGQITERKLADITILGRVIGTIEGY